MELRFGEAVQVLDLEEGDQLAETIRKQLAIYQVQTGQQATPADTEEIIDQPTLW
jgi:hypothetical protein